MPRPEYKPVFDGDGITLYHGDCLKVIKTMPDESIDSLVTDPPAGIAFMGKEWDDTRTANYKVYSGKVGITAPRIGQHKGNHTEHMRAGDTFVAFLTTAMVEALRILKPGAFGLVWAIPRTSHWTATALENAGFEIRDRIAHLFGVGFPKSDSCLKPACEDWWLVRKPGKMQPLQINECRISLSAKDAKETTHVIRQQQNSPTFSQSRAGNVTSNLKENGRWPANVVLDEEAGRLLDAQSGQSTSSSRPRFTKARKNIAKGPESDRVSFGHSDSGGASRFFYCVKASKDNRDDGNDHPTVKNTNLMEWLVKLITPSRGVCLDCFLGSGSTALACLKTNRKLVGIEKELEYIQISIQRIKDVQGASFKKQLAKQLKQKQRMANKRSV